MPRDYAGLCRVFLPRPIHDEIGYRNTVEIAGVFAGFEDQMTADQNDYFGLLCEHGLAGADLSRILGRSLPPGSMI